MPTALKRKIAWTAILVIVLQALLPGIAAFSASASDPATVICHSDAAADVGQSVPRPASTDDCCAQCILCSGLASAAPAVAPTHVVWTLPAEVLSGRSSPESVAAHQPNTNFARGPPLSA